MAELSTVTRTKVAQVAGSKMTATANNRERVAIIDTAAAYSAANGDTFGTGIIIPKGARLLAPYLSNAAGNASSTLSIGIRDAVTGVAIDATALINAASLAAASAGQISTGTKIVNGQYYVMPQDVELYGTFGGATPLANAAIRVEVQYVAP
ncbi:hypothetical protein [Herbaspirillum aquaticum]|uniref:Uncharacterized protein n=1 Tax=Herbaspirillum aquaticum TaxID=568783 RepID=A0A225SVS5_9BURK|nr:hypothetical protein [Herbaspirillum aquaticum]OWY35296.1 hypothetical protein CEJ45_08465 [Herbaspirillum aquaticum]